MDLLGLITKYYEPYSQGFYYLVQHSLLVCKKALEIAQRVSHLKPNIRLVIEGAMLHDIGIFQTKAPQLGCNGQHPYIAHGYLGAVLLEREGYPAHALICERHVGMGLTIKDIEKKDFPLPKKDMVPVSLEEKIVCYADKFFTKGSGRLNQELALEEVRAIIRSYGEDKLEFFEGLHRLFREGS